MFAVAPLAISLRTWLVIFHMPTIEVFTSCATAGCAMASVSTAVSMANEVVFIAPPTETSVHCDVRCASRRPFGLARSDRPESGRISTWTRPFLLATSPWRVLLWTDVNGLDAAEHSTVPARDRKG